MSSVPEWVVGWTLNRGVVKVGLIEMTFEQTPEEVWEEGEEFKTFQNILRLAKECIQSINEGQ